MYKKGDKTLSIAEAQEAANFANISIEQWAEQYGWALEGKQNGSTTTTPVVGPQPLTPAGDSSLGDISLESPDLNPYLLKLEDVTGSEEEVYDKISSKLKAIGIDTEEYIPGADAIKLTARSGKTRSAAWATSNENERLENFNNFIKENADLTYAEASIKGRESLLKEYSTATSVNISDKEAEREYVKSKIAEWKQKETLDFGMGQRQTIELKQNDFSTPEEYKAYTEWKKTGILDPDKAKVKEAKQLLIAQQKEAKGEKFVRDLSKEDKDALQAYTAKKVVDTKYRTENLDREVEEINNIADNLNKAIESYNKDPKSVPPIILRKMVADWQGKVESFESFVETLDTEETKDLSLALNNLSKEYSLIKKLGIGFKSQGINLAYGGMQILSGAGYIFDAVMTDATLEENIEKSVSGVQEAFQKPLQDVAREQARLSKGTSFEDALNSPGDLVNWSANAFVQAVPSLAMAFTGSAAMPLFFVSGYGGKAAEVANEEYAAAERMAENALLLESEDITEEQRIQIESQMAEDAKLLNIPAWKEMTASTIGGIAEVLFERLSTIRIIKGANSAINPLKPQIHKAVLKSARDEGLSEGATQFVNNIADAALLDKNVNLFDGVGEAIAGGALVGSVLELRNAAPMVFDNIAFSLGTKSELNDFRKDFQKLKELTGLDDVTALLDQNVPTPAQSPEVESLVNSIVKKINNRKTNIVERIGKDLTEDDLLRIGELNIKMKRINERYAKIGLTAKPSELKAAEATLREEFDALAQERDDILTDQARGMDAIALNASRQINMMAFEEMLFGVEAVRKEVQAINDFDSLDEVSKNERLKQAKEKYNLTDKETIEQKAIEDYKIERNKEAIAEDEKRIQTFLEASGLADKIKVRKLSETEFKKLGLDKGPGETDAVIIDGEIIVNEDVAARNGRIAVFSHEVLHAITSDVLGNNGGNQAGKDLLGWLEQNSPDTYTYIKARLDKLYEGNSAYYEEAMNALSDYIAEGNTVDLETIGRIQLFFNKIFKGSKAKQLSLNDAAKTFAFIAQYADKNKTSKTKELIKNFQRGLRGEEEEKALKKSLSAAAGRAKDALDKMQEQGYDPNSIELYEILQGMVSAQLSKYQAKGLQITDEEEAISDVVSRLYTQRDVNKFDGRGSVYGYLNGRIKFRILDALKANPVWVENFENIDVEGLEGKATRQVATEEVETEVVAPAAIVSEAEVTQQVNNRPEYKNLLRRRVVEPEVIKSIEEKVLKTVRLLKSRIDAQVSKNVTVVPIIREIKKEMGKQADIDFKTAMGGKKDGELRKFLLRNKAAILENMSTTWLSTAMPIAIQKKVDGVWTSDWKGKKIDRESTATDMAGRTSGAELVRRMPNAMRNISDADFLATILQPDGNPIRGKKESLAKAMAEEISFDIIKQALEDTNSPIAQALIENQKRLGVENAENLGPEFVRLSERGNVKFSKSLSKNIALTMAKYDSLASRADKLELVEDSIDDLLSKYNVFGRYNLKNPEEAKLWVADIKENLVPLMPKNFWFPKEDNINSFLLSNKGVFNGLTKEQFESLRDLINTEIRNAPDTKYGEPLSGIKDFNPQFKRFNKGKLIDLTARNILLDEESALWATESGTMLKYNVYAETVHRIMWRRIYDKIRENKNNARGIATWLAFSTNDLSHPQRNMIAIGGWSINFKREDVTLEHATPNVATLQALLDMSLKEASELSPNETGNWNFYYSAIASNYKLIALNQSDDNKAGKFFKSKMSAEYNIITGTWWDRYFNLYTAKVEGYTLQKDENGKLKRVYDGTRGIEPKTIMLPSGKLLSEVTGIDKRGGYRYTKIADMIDTLVEEYGVGRFKRETRSIAAKFKVEDEAWENGKRKYSKSFPPPQVLSNQFNKILERKTGIDADQEFSRIRGQLAGKGKGRFRFFVAPGAEDFRGLVHYAFAGKGEQGDKDLEFFEKNLMEPYFKGIAAIDSTRQIIKREFKVVVDEYKAEYKMLSENIPDSPYTYDHALRVYLWASQGTNIPGLDAKDQAFLENTILDNPALADLGEALMIVGRKETWPKPSEFWEGDSVLADLNSMTEKVGRKEILSQFIQNADAIFTEANLNKIEAAKGRAHREAIEDALYSMKSGTNRPSGANQQMNRWLNWINGSTGAIMFFNRRSALLQMLSATNFINWSDNNPVKAAAAFANQAQYWKDFVYIFNSDKLKERRGGLKQDVSESEIAQVAGRSKNSPQAILSYLLKIGFTPTQIADSLAISMGGATFYRNRINTYVKQGMSQKDAEERAWLDFSKTSDEAQQSSDPALVSKEQRSVLGRLVLAFANTPMQYTRLMKKAGMDLINGRGDWKTNVSKIAYYGFVQNFIFSALQGALFALAFDDEEDDEKAQQDADRKVARTIHSMIDTVVRGSGIYGAVATTIKNTILQYYQQEEKGYMADHTYTVLSAVGISPPIGSKLRKLYGAIQTRKFEKDNIAARGWALTADGRLNLGPNWAIAGQVLSGTLNIPLDRVVDELKSISEALDSRNKAWQRIALALGWKTWDVGVKNEEADLIETQAKEIRKQKGIEKAKETRRKKKEQEAKPPRRPGQSVGPTVGPPRK